MKLRLRRLIFFGVIGAFAVGLLCSTLAAPGRSLAAVTDCSQNNNDMAMNGCEDPNFCGSSSPSNLRAALTLSRIDDLSTHVLGVLVAEVLRDAGDGDALMPTRGGAGGPRLAPPKVSVRLFNSMLNL